GLMRDHAKGQASSFELSKSKLPRQLARTQYSTPKRILIEPAAASAMVCCSPLAGGVCAVEATGTAIRQAASAARRRRTGTIFRITVKGAVYRNIPGPCGCF